MLIILHTLKLELREWNLSSGVLVPSKLLFSAPSGRKGVLGVFGASKQRFVWSSIPDDLSLDFMLQLTGERTFLEGLLRVLILSLAWDNVIQHLTVDISSSAAAAGSFIRKWKLLLILESCEWRVYGSGQEAVQVPGTNTFDFKTTMLRGTSDSSLIVLLAARSRSCEMERPSLAV